MKSIFLRGAILCVAFLTMITVSIAGENGEKPGKHLLWEARSNKGIVYIFGSIHMAKPEFYPLPGEVEETFEKADALALEADPERVDPGLQQKIFSAALYPPGDTLQRHMSKENYELAAREMRKIGLSADTYMRMKPWFLGLTIAILQFQRLGYAPEYGVDRYFSGKARGKKKIVELESFDYQLNLLSSFNEREQELFLIYSILDMKYAEKDIDRLVRSWQTGDTKAMEMIVTQSLKECPELMPVFEKLFYRRNREMAAKIEQYLQSKETYFVVVGAAHLVGQQGIIGLLKGKGYKIKQL